MECLPRKELQELGDKKNLVANLKQFLKALQKYQEHCTSILKKWENAQASQVTFITVIMPVSLGVVTILQFYKNLSYTKYPDGQ